MDAYNNEEEQDLEEYEVKDSRYIPCSFCSQDKSNRSKDLGKGIRNLNHLVYIPKLPNQIIANFLLEFLDEGDSKAQKKYLLVACKKE